MALNKTTDQTLSETTKMTSEHCHGQVIELDHVTFADRDRPIIDGLSFAMLQRDFVCLAGSNGAGKTTLLRMIVGLLEPTGGEIRLFGEPIKRFRDWHKIGYVPQKSALNPLFPATVAEVVESGLYGRRTMFRRILPQERRKVTEALEVMDVPDLAKRRIGQLSGGQQQRVFLARALVNRPELLILDEPTVGIDVETQNAFFHLIRHMHQHHPLSLLIVTHDMDAISSYVGDEPKMTSGKLKLFVRHSHEPEDCNETGLSHPLAELRATVPG